MELGGKKKLSTNTISSSIINWCFQSLSRCVLMSSSPGSDAAHIASDVVQRDLVFSKHLTGLYFKGISEVRISHPPFLSLYFLSL